MTTTPIDRFHIERCRFLYQRSAWIALMWLVGCPKHDGTYFEVFSDN